MNDPANWCGWDRAKHLKPDQRGFMLGDGIGSVAIPDCVTQRGEVDPSVLAKINTFAELTPDGRGVQLIGWLPDEAAPNAHTWVPLTGERVGPHTTLAVLDL